MDPNEPNATASVASAIERELQETYFDTGQYIATVKALPVLWDSSTEDYSNRVLRNRAWQALVDKYGGNNLVKLKRNELLQQLRKKWTNLRAAYTRELKRQTGLKAYAAKSEYIYFQQLNFLEHIVCPQGAENCEEGELGLEHLEQIPGNIKRVNKDDVELEPVEMILADSDDEGSKPHCDTSSTGGTTQFKTLDFIADIKMRPAIWDPKADGVCSAGAKRRCWNEIVEKYGSHLSHLKKKNLEYKLKNEWRSMQNGFWRVVRRCGHDAGVGSRNKYEYFRELQFLNKVMTPKEPEEDQEFVEVQVNIDDIESVENDESKDNSDDSSDGPNDRKRKINDTDAKDLEDHSSEDCVTINPMHTIKIEETRTHTRVDSINDDEIKNSPEQTNVEHVQVLSDDEHIVTPEHIRKRRKHTQDTNEDEVTNCETQRLQDESNNDREKDEDRLFLLSLLNSLKSVPESRKMSVKKKMMNLLEGAARENV